MVNYQDNTIDNIVNGGNDTCVRDDEYGIEAHKEIVTARTTLKLVSVSRLFYNGRQISL